MTQTYLFLRLINRKVPSIHPTMTSAAIDTPIYTLEWLLELADTPFAGTLRSGNKLLKYKTEFREEPQSQIFV